MEKNSQVYLLKRMLSGLTIAFFFLFCHTIPKDIYEIEPLPTKIDRTRKSLRINLFQDKREGENTDRNLLALVPFFISGDLDLNFPESDPLSIPMPAKYFFAEIIQRETANKNDFSATGLYYNLKKLNFVHTYVMKNLMTQVLKDTEIVFQ